MKKLIITILIILLAGIAYAGVSKSGIDSLEKPKKGIYFSETDDGKLNIEIVGFTGITEAAEIFLQTVADQYFVKYKAMMDELRACRGDLGEND